MQRARWLLLPILLGVGLRLLAGAELSHLAQFQSPGGDGLGYLQWADRLRTQGWMGKEVFDRAPLYLSLIHI